MSEIWDRLFRLGDEEAVKLGRKPKATNKVHLKVLLLDIYVCWAADPTQYIAVHLSKSGWRANSRYNALHLSSRMINVIKVLHEHNFIELHLGFEGRLSRIRALEKLELLFASLNAPQEAILFNHLREPLELRRRSEADKKKERVEYDDTPETVRMREVLSRYNTLLSQAHIDICSLEDPIVERIITSGKDAGRKQRLSINRSEIFVRRIFNNGSWEQGGRFYGGWWQGIGKDLRHDIMINNKPTIEIDFKAMHVALLFAAMNQQSEFDPYSLEDELLAGFSLTEQRSVLKQLVLMALNSDTRSQAFRAFRSDQSKDSSRRKLKDKELGRLLTAFTNTYPSIEPYICSGKGLQLMYLDSCIAEQVIEHFTEQSIPVLCVHDSFIIQYDKVLELRATMVKAAGNLTSRYMFTDKQAYGLDEWFKEVYNTGVKPDWEPKTVVRCEGYNRRWSNYKKSSPTPYSITST